jgi:glycosyltransferase involved in cell wall biosynthesis
VDDGSTDSSGDILDKYAELDNRIRVIHNSHCGTVCTRKVGKQIAIGDYLMDVDGDDWIETDRVEILVNAINDKPADLIYMSGMYRDTENISILSEHYFVDEMFYAGEKIEFEFLPLIADINKSLGKMLIRNSYLWAVKAPIGKFCQSMVNDDALLLEDSAFVYWYLQYCNSVLVISNPTYHYLQREQSVSHRNITLNELRNSAKTLFNSEEGMHFSSEFSRKLVDNLIYFNMVNLCCFEEDDKVIYPFSNIKKNSDVAVYGCGGYGQRFVRKMIETRACNITCWVDRNVRQYDEINKEVKDISKLNEVEFDFVVIAIINEDIAMEVSNNLISMGIPKDKIAMIDKNYMKTEKFAEYFKNVQM